MNTNIKLGHILNRLFGKTYVRNLKQSTERRQFIHEQCSQIGLEYEIFEAVDGTTLCDESFTLQHGPYFLRWPSSAGFLGIQKTNHLLITKIIELDLPSCILLDDDCIFSHTATMTESSLNSVESSIPPDWDMIILGDIWDPTTPVDQTIICSRCTQHRQAAGSHGIAVNRSIYREMQHLLSGTQWLGDGVVGRLIDEGKNIYKFFPSLCHQNRSLFSDINKCFHKC